MDDVPYRWFDHTADVGLEVDGETLDALFANAARGFYELAGAPFPIDRPIHEEIRLRGADIEELLVSWLGELLYRLSMHGRWYDAIDVRVTGDVLKAKVSGGILPDGAPRAEREVKAVTYHDLLVARRDEGGWRARLVFDV